MQIFQSTNNQNTFKFNGLTYPKNFMCIKQGAENIAIHNAYDTRQQLLGSSHYSNVEVNGVIFASQAELMAALSTLLFAKQFNYVVQDLDATRLISIGDITVDTNYVTIEPATWIINGVDFETFSNTVLTVPFATSGKTRIDIIVANSANQIVRIEGVETTGIAVSPIPPIDTVYLSQININDNNIGTPSIPITGSIYVKKEEYSENYIDSTGVVTLDLLEDKTAFRFINGDVNSVRGFNTNAFFTNSVIYVGKEVKIVNNQSNSITLKYNDTSTDIPMIFPNGNDLILNENEVAIFKLTKTSELIAEFISINRVSTTNTSTNNYLSLTGGTVSGVTSFISGLEASNITLSDDNGFSSLNGSYWEMFNNDGYYFNLSNDGLNITDLLNNCIFNAVGMYVADDINYSEYQVSKIKQNGIEYFLPTGTTSQIATKADILNNVSGLTLNNVTTNGNSTGNSLIVTNGVYTTTHSNNGLVASFSGGSSTLNSTQISSTNGSSTNSITPLKSSITEGSDTFEVTKSNLSLSNAISGFSVSVNITNGFSYNSTGGLYTHYSLNKINNNGIDYLLPTGTTSQIATKADITSKWQGVDDVNSGSGVSGTTIETLDKTYVIPANTLTNGHLDFSLYSIRETGASLAHTVVCKVNNVNVFSGASEIFRVNTGGNFSPHLRHQRKFTLKDNLIKDANLTSNVNIGAAATGIAAPFNLTSDNYIFFSVIPSNTNQTIKFDSIQIKQL